MEDLVLLGTVIAVGIAGAILLGNIAGFVDRREMARSGSNLSPHPGANKSQDQFLETAVMQMLQEADSIQAEYLTASDGFLHTYWTLPINWESIWRRRRQTVRDIPPFATKLYWAHRDSDSKPVPVSLLAFMSTQARLRIATDPQTETHILGLIAGDAAGTGRGERQYGDVDGQVFQAAFRRL